MNFGQGIYENYDCVLLHLHGGAFDGDACAWCGPIRGVPREVKMEEGRRVYHYVAVGTPYRGDRPFRSADIMHLDMYLAAEARLARERFPAMAPIDVAPPPEPEASPPIAVAAPPTFLARLRAMLGGKTA